MQFAGTLNKVREVDENNEESNNREIQSCSGTSTAVLLHTVRVPRRGIGHVDQTNPPVVERITRTSKLQVTFPRLTTMTLLPPY